MKKGLAAGIALGLLVVAGTGCPASGSGSGTTTASGSTGAGSNGSSTSSGSGSTGSSGSGTSGSGTSGTGTSGTTTSGTGTTGGTSSGSTGGGLDAGAPCGQGLAWFGDVCAAPDCSRAPVGVACFLGDGGLGSCIGLSCAALDTSQDSKNCGAYGIACPKGLFCSNGFCITAGGGGVDCTVHVCTGRLCVDQVGCLPAACDATVQAETCVFDGGGTAGTTNTPFGICCGTACDDIGNDVNNCGNCGIQCAPGELCVARACVLAETCGPTNNGRSCALASGAAGTCCLGTCVDLKSDTANCGSCAQGCLVDAGCQDGLCVGGELACPPGTDYDGYCVPLSCSADSYGTWCFPDGGPPSAKCCPAGCVDLSSDSQNCGGCDRACAPGVACIGGTCYAFADCTVSSGTTCALDGGGGATGTCCQGLCSDTSSDDLNCGTCGTPCPTGSHCTGYQCFTTGGGAAVCDTGGCPGTTECIFERCVPTDCGALPRNATCAIDAGLASAFGSCCGLACVDIISDPSNCGGCGLACPSGSSCTFYQCQAGTGSGDCPAGTACAEAESPCLGTCLSPDCSGLPGGANCLFAPAPFVSPDQVCCGASCVNLVQDPSNCGTCGTSCPSGVCYLGCFDPDPPGGCLATCAQYTRCVEGQCIDSTCTGQSFGQRCLAADGTVGVCCGTAACGHLLDDPQNCGACGITCPPGQTCSSGTCSGSPSCGPGHIGQFCDLDAGLSFLCCPGAGCIDTSSDARNCGTCGNACPPGTTCQSGSCF